MVNEIYKIVVNGIYNMSTPLVPENSSVATHDMLIGALLRVPAAAVQRRIITSLNTAGYTELRLAHMAVFQFPGPDRCRPIEIADRAGMSRQAMNQLLRSLEGYGYLSRSDSTDQERARAVFLTERGHAAYSKILDILQDIERDWSAELGPKKFAQLKQLLFRVWESPLIS
jgi:DNA-binding MarR family transcriptional regulator